jgi:uncharacterized protein YbbC (DUF1343 family)
MPYKRYLVLLFLIFTSTIFSQESTNIRLGIDSLISLGCKDLFGKRVAVLANFASRNSDGNHTVDLLNKFKEFRISVIFTPEHGFYSTVPAGIHVSDSTYKGIRIISLYGNSRKPSKEMLDSCDVIVIDVQDIGVRSYTYISSIYNVVSACFENDKEVIILDRPNPIGGLIVDGNVVEKGLESFVGIAPVSYIHGCTVAELVSMFLGEGWIKTKDTTKQLVKYKLMPGWQRWMTWEDTGLNWIPTSPNIPTVNAVRGAALTGIIGEIGIISIGMGTSLPFQYLGSDELDLSFLEQDITQCCGEGLLMLPTIYQQETGKYAKKQCKGFFFNFTKSNLFRPYHTCINILLSIRSHYPELFSSLNNKTFDMFRKVTGSSDLLKMLTDGTPDDIILRESDRGLPEYLQIRSKYLKY